MKIFITLVVSIHIQNVTETGTLSSSQLLLQVKFDPADNDRIITRLCPRPQKQVLQSNSNDLDKTLQTVSINHDISQDDCFPQYRARAVATGSLANQDITTTSPPLLTATPSPNANPPSVVSSLSPPQTI